MLKKVLIAAVAVLLGLTVVKKTQVGSYVQLWWKNAKECAQQQVPVETEIERLREEVARLGKDTTTHYSDIAEEMVAVGNLEKDINLVKANLEKQERSILTMRTDLKSETQFITYGDNKYPRKEVESQLKRDWASYQRCKEDLQAKEKLLEARKEALSAARDQLAAMRSMQSDLEVELARMEAELKTVRVAQTKSKFHLDDSKLSRIKEDVAQVRDRIEVQKKQLEVQAEFANGRIDVNAKSSQDILGEIDSHFGKTEGNKVASQNK